MKIASLLLAGLLLAAPVGQLSAHLHPAVQELDQPLDAATTQRVLTAAAAHYGTTYAVLNAEHQSGAVRILDLGPGAAGHWYEVVRNGHPSFKTEDLIIG